LLGSTSMLPLSRRRAKKKEEVVIVVVVILVYWMHVKPVRCHCGLLQVSVLHSIT